MRRTIIDARRYPALISLRELFEFRDLFITMAYRDLRVRYTQSFLGLAWAAFQPITSLTIFIIVFGRIAKIDTGEVPYPVFAACGIGVWTYFAAVISQSSISLVSMQGMIGKIYFPRVIIPLSKSLAAMVEWGVALSFVVILMLFYGSVPSGNIVFLPLFIVLNAVSALGLGIWVSALTVRYRDMQHIVPFLVQLGMYISPVAYPAETVAQNLPTWAAWAYHLNPAAGVITGVRWSLFGTAPLDAFSYLSFALAIALFFSGLLYFKRVEKVMADIV